LDDRASSVVYDPKLKLLAVGRESGRLELWDTRRVDSRIARGFYPVSTDCWVKSLKA
jgi:hypothetical protein